MQHERERRSSISTEFSLEELTQQALSWDALYPIIEASYPADDHALIHFCYLNAQVAHEGVTRASGELYFIHPIRTLHILRAAGLNDASLAGAALLHDVDEDTSYLRRTEMTVSRTIVGNSYLHNTLSGAIGYDTAEMIDNVTVMQGPPETKKKREGHAINALKLTQEMRSLLLKWADRIDNLETLSIFPPEKQEKKINETLDIFLPIFMRVFIDTRYVRPGEYLLDRMFQAIETLGYKDAIKKHRLRLDTPWKRMQYGFDMDEKFQREEETLEEQFRDIDRERQAELGDDKHIDLLIHQYETGLYEEDEL